MPRYFFHIRENGHLQEDPEGAEFASDAAALAEAVKAARELLADLIMQGEVVDGQRFEITDEHGKVIHILAFRDVMRLE